MLKVNHVRNDPEVISSYISAPSQPEVDVSIQESEADESNDREVISSGKNNAVLFTQPEVDVSIQESDEDESNDPEAKSPDKSNGFLFTQPEFDTSSQVSDENGSNDPELKSPVNNNGFLLTQAEFDTSSQVSDENEMNDYEVASSVKSDDLVSTQPEADPSKKENDQFKDEFETNKEETSFLPRHDLITKDAYMNSSSSDNTNIVMSLQSDTQETNENEIVRDKAPFSMDGADDCDSMHCDNENTSDELGDNNISLFTQEEFQNEVMDHVMMSSGDVMATLNLNPSPSKGDEAKMKEIFSI